MITHETRLTGFIVLYIMFRPDRREYRRYLSGEGAVLQRGLINQLLGMAGIGRVSWFGNQKVALIPLILLTVWQFGSSMIIFAAGLKQIPTTYYEAAKIDGANRRKSFFKITLPCLSPVILYNLVMQTISAFMTFTQAFVITSGGPNDATNFYALYMYNNAFTYRKMGYASAMS